MSAEDQAAMRALRRFHGPGNGEAALATDYTGPRCDEHCPALLDLTCRDDSKGPVVWLTLAVGGVGGGGGGHPGADPPTTRILSANRRPIRSQNGPVRGPHCHAAAMPVAAARSAPTAREARIRVQADPRRLRATISPARHVITDCASQVRAPRLPEMRQALSTPTTSTVAITDHDWVARRGPNRRQVVHHPGPSEHHREQRHPALAASNSHTR